MIYLEEAISNGNVTPKQKIDISWQIASKFQQRI